MLFRWYCYEIIVIVTLIKYEVNLEYLVCKCYEFGKKLV